MSLLSWKSLTKGDRDELILSVDFSTSGRTQATFADLAARLDPPTATVWTTLPPTADDAVALDGYVDWWLGNVRQSGRRVTAVLGYCAGAVFAAALAERIGEWQDTPAVVLFDPELPNTVGLYKDFHSAGDSMASLLMPEELEEFHEAGREIERRYADDLAAVGPELALIFTRAVGTAAERLELDDDIRDELAGVFGSLVGYLAAASHIDPLPLWTRAIAITSGRPAYPVGREIRIDVDHDDLLRINGAARALSELLSGDRTESTAGR